LRSSEVVSGIGDRAGIENVGVDEAWKDAAAAKSFKLRMTMNLNEQWKNHKHLQMSPLFFAPPSFLQDFSSNITLLRHPQDSEPLIALHRAQDGLIGMKPCQPSNAKSGPCNRWFNKVKVLIACPMFG
jgi:hypothetical protein